MILCLSKLTYKKSYHTEENLIDYLYTTVLNKLPYYILIFHEMSKDSLFLKLQVRSFKTKSYLHLHLHQLSINIL